MSDEFGNDIITISDEDGNEYVLEHLDTIEKDGAFYMACLPADVDEDDDDFGLVILEAEGEDELVAIEDEQLLEHLYDLFMERLFEEDDMESDEDE